jgi:adenylate cyclase
VDLSSKRLKKYLAAAAVGVAVFLVILVLHASDRLWIAELKTLDHRFQQYADPASARKDIVLVAVDEPSLETFGRWPWPRDRHGYMTHYLKQAGARAIVFDILFLEPDDSAEEFDQAFADETRAAGNVFLSYLLQKSPGPSPSPTILKKIAIPVQAEESRERTLARPEQGVKLPIPLLADAARGMGYINLFPDHDGITRRLPLLITTGEPHSAFLHLAGAVARDLLNADGATFRSSSLQLGTAAIPLTKQSDLILDWHGTLKQQAYASYSAGAVLKAFSEMQQGKAPSLDPALFKDKIVFIAGTAAGTYDLRVTPLSPATPGVLIHMTALDNILRGRYMQPAPYAAFAGTTLLLCLLTAWSFMLVESQVLKFSLIFGLAAAYYGVVVHAFTSHGLWLEVAFPEGAIAATFALAASVEYLTEGRQRRALRAVFDKYMAPEVVDELMRDPAAIKLGGERKELTVLFSDVAGFTSISERLQPEGLVELLNEYLSAMTDIILRHRGNVNKYLGDGIMAIFGAPRNEPSHATLACYTAIESQEALSKLRAEWKAKGHPEISARIGINTGQLVVGNMGSQARMEYTVMGDSVNLASRLEGANKFYSTLILLGPRTYELAKEDIEAREVDLLRVKGKQAPVVVYELLSRKGALEPRRRQVVDAYLRGLASYKAGHFEEARRAFEEALDLDPLDGPSKVYRERAIEFLAHPPGSDWSGVYELHSK